jgi:hypothetical protein
MEKAKTITREEARLQRVAVLRELADLYAEIAREGADAPSVEPEPADKVIAAFNAKLISLPLADASIEFLRTCSKPQTAKQILKALEKAGRQFETQDRVRAVLGALRKALPRIDDLFHLNYGKWHLKSKYPTKAKLQKVLAMKAKLNGTGGRSPTEHSARTKAGLDVARQSGKILGREATMTPDKIEQAREMLKAGKRTREVADHFGVVVSCLYNLGLSPRKIKAEQEGTNVVPLRKASNE